MTLDRPTDKIDLSKNPRQGEYFNEVMAAAIGTTSRRFFCYGGAIRGGKTAVTLAILIFLCRMFPRSRWHIVRDDLPNLKKTTIPSLEKFLPNTGFNVNRDPGNFFYEYRNGSRIYIMPENLSRDPELKSFLGLETNGFFLEQAEELSPLLWEKAKERTGSWYIDPMPPGFIFLTVNPTYTWSRRVFYEPWRRGELPDNYFYLNALPTDNPFVTGDQWASWSEMSPELYAQFVEGNWDYDNRADGVYEYEAVVDYFTNFFIPRTGLRYITADPAYGGADHFVVGIWDDWVLYDVQEYPKTSSLDVTAILRQTALRHGVPASRIVFDATGSGEHLKGDLRGAVPFLGGSMPIDTSPKNKTLIQKDATKRKAFANLRAQCFFASGRRMSERAMLFDIPSAHLQERAMEELLAIRRLDLPFDKPQQIIAKEDIKAALKRSPGIADIISMREIFELRPYRKKQGRKVRAG